MNKTFALTSDSHYAYVANDPHRSRHFQPCGLAVTADSAKLYVTRFLSFTKPGRQQDDGLDGPYWALRNLTLPN